MELSEGGNNHNNNTNQDGGGGGVAKNNINIIDHDVMIGGGGSDDNNNNNLPYFISIQRLGDFLKLEKFLRRQLKCQGSTCSFLQSADYAAVKIAVMHALRGAKVSADFAVSQIVCIPKSSLILCLADNHTSIMIREQEMSVSRVTSSSTPIKKKRKSMADDVDEVSNNSDKVEEESPLAAVSSVDLSFLESKFVTAIAKQRQSEKADAD